MQNPEPRAAIEPEPLLIGTMRRGPTATAGRLVRTFERRVMASPLRMTLVLEPGRRQRSIDPDAAWAAVSDEFDAVDLALSRFRDDSEVTALNRLPGGRPVRVGRRLYRSLAVAERAWRQTEGAFDPRVLRDLERLGHRGAPIGGGLPAPVSSGHWLRRDPRAWTVAIDAPVDLGGIGKGLAVRWAMRRLARTAGLPFGPGFGALIDAGGDLAAAGPSPDGGLWSIGIEDPQDGEDSLAVVGLNRGAVCTSSIRLGQWVDSAGRLVHHLIDPTTGAPGGAGLVAVTVAASDPAWAEVWSKTLFLAGPRAIGAMARGRGLAAWWLGEDGELSMTPGARQMTVWSRT
jgi:FAD:protein FMN transferase